MARGPTLGVIPARWASTRFPGKPLALLAGRPMVQHVWEKARAAAHLDRVLVATDDTRIADVVQRFGGEVHLSTADHATGSDRVAEVARSRESGIVVNIQGDEPLLPPAAIDAAIRPLVEDETLDATTLAAPVSSEQDLLSPNVVKVVVAVDGHALYFSRLPVPYVRQIGGSSPAHALHHIGLFAYRRDFLLRFAGWPPTPLERAEGLEQLRILENGCRLGVVQVAPVPAGVDTPEDLARVERLLAARP